MRTPIPVTLLYGGMVALLLTFLGLNVSLLRIKHRVYLTPEIPKPLFRPIRAHGNAAEWAPIGILLLAMLELSGVRPLPLHLLGGTLLLARSLQAFGALAKNRATMVAATLTYTLMTTMSLWAVVLHFRAR